MITLEWVGGILDENLSSKYLEKRFSSKYLEAKYTEDNLEKDF